MTWEFHAYVSTPKGMENIFFTTQTHTNVYSSIIHKSQEEEAQCSLRDEWINKTCSLHTMEYYLPIKRDKVLIHGLT